ncbi:MAG: hypothetical protein JSU04_11190 [Bdellovibrionales bacterium]|nr:hypothetical protein [Bdellovibrionales bacterium]
MIKTLRTTMMTLVLFASTASFAGGILCKQCPVESDQCVPVNCPSATKGSQAKCTNDSAINDFLKPVVKTAAGVCCSDLEVQGCFKGC